MTPASYWIEGTLMFILLMGTLGFIIWCLHWFFDDSWGMDSQSDNCDPMTPDEEALYKQLLEARENQGRGKSK